MTQVELPIKLGERLKLALHDLEACETDPDYIPDMNNWHEPAIILNENPKCHVCLAGAVMAKTFKIDKLESIGLYEGAASPFSDLQKKQLLQLDSLRGGYLSDIFSYQQIELILATGEFTVIDPDSGCSAYIKVPEYGYARNKFMDTMYRLANRLITLDL